MLTNEQYLLGKLAEEASELAQIAIKAQQFGMDRVFGRQNGDALSNFERVSAEFNDVLGIVQMLWDEEDINIARDHDAIKAKMQKVACWRDVARKEGYVE